MYQPGNINNEISDQEFKYHFLRILDQQESQLSVIATHLAAISITAERDHGDVIGDHTTDDGQMTLSDAVNLVIRSLCAEKSTSLKQVADAMGEDYGKLRRRIAHGTLGMDDIAGIAGAFGMTPGEFMSRAMHIRNADDGTRGESHE